MKISAFKWIIFCASPAIFGISFAQNAALPNLNNSSADYQLADPDQAWIADTMSRLSLRDKIAQLIQIRVYGKFLNRQSAEFAKIEKDIRENHIGGLVLFAGTVYESALLLNQLQEESALPLLVASDFERGASFRISDTSPFPWTMAIGATGSEEFAYREGEVAAREARALGVHWLFAPVVDVNNNPDNPVINIRSFGEDPQMVARLGAAFIRGARQAGALTTAKHFPGHGDTASDSHIGLPVVNSDLARLEAVELAPFRSAVEAGVDSIMTAHVAVPQVTKESDIPATLSASILTDLLRGSLKFRGLVVTDALEMGAITSRYWTGLAAIRALSAGADVLLLPADATVAINEVERAVKRGDISEARIDQSVERLLAAKTQVGLHVRRTVPVDRITEVISSPDSLKLTQDIADQSITLVKDSQHLLPINPLRAPKIFSIVLSSEADTSPGAIFQAELRKRFASVRTAWADPRTPDDLLASIAKNASDSELIICSTLIRVVTGKGSVSLPDNHREIVKRLFASGKPIIWIAFGNPYVLRLYPQAKSYLCAFSYSDVSQIAAAKALSGEISVTGKMPVSIPGQSLVGDGLQIPRLDMTLKPSGMGSTTGPPDEFEQTRQKLASFAEANTLAGVSLTIGLKGSIVFDTTTGILNSSRYSQFLASPSAFDLPVLSEALVTTPAAMLLVDEGRLLLDAPVQDYLPEFRGPRKESVLVQDLLFHSSGLPESLPGTDTESYETLLTAVCAMPLNAASDTGTLKSVPDLILLAEIESRAAGRSLGSYLSENLYGPLHSNLSSVATDSNGRPPIAGPEQKESNLASSARTIAVFSQMLLNRGLYDHRRYLRPETVDRFAAARRISQGSQGLGWIKPTSTDWQGRIFSRTSFGTSDAYELFLWIDPTKQLFILLLTNPGADPSDPQKVDNARRELCETIIQALPAIERKAR
jgi:beta-N-acetylhexosaminidase